MHLVIAHAIVCVGTAAHHHVAATYAFRNGREKNEKEKTPVAMESTALYLDRAQALQGNVSGRCLHLGANHTVNLRCNVVLDLDGGLARACPSLQAGLEQGLEEDLTQSL